MEHLSKGSESASNSVLDKFRELYGAELVEIRYEEVPPIVLNHFEAQSKKYILPESYRVGNFDKVYRFNHPNGDVTYIGQQDKDYDTDGLPERLSYLVDTRGDAMTGYIEVRYSLDQTDEYFSKKPFVGFTRTHEGFERQGLGIRRLEEANAHSLAEYGYPLHSDTLISDEAKAVWERLVEEGKTEKFKEGDHDRYRFIAPER